MEGANRKLVEADPQSLQVGLHMVRCGISAIPSLPRRLGQASSGTKNYPEKRSQGAIFAALGPKMRSKKGSFLRSQNATAISLPLRIPSINHFFGLVLRPRFRIKIRPKKRRLERNFGCNLKPISGLGGQRAPRGDIEITPEILLRGRSAWTRKKLEPTPSLVRRPPEAALRFSRISGANVY